MENLFTSRAYRSGQSSSLYVWLSSSWLLVRCYTVESTLPLHTNTYNIDNTIIATAIPKITGTYPVLLNLAWDWQTKIDSILSMTLPGMLRLTCLQLVVSNYSLDDCMLLSQRNGYSLEQFRFSRSVVYFVLPLQVVLVWVSFDSRDTNKCILRLMSCSCWTCHRRNVCIIAQLHTSTRFSSVHTTRARSHTCLLMHYTNSSVFVGELLVSCLELFSFFPRSRLSLNVLHIWVWLEECGVLLRTLPLSSSLRRHL